MQPGSERTVVVNIIHNLYGSDGEPCRLVATLEDWRILKNGDVDFYTAGTQRESANPWIIYSPAEVLVQPGKVHPIRVTISVPKGATPGERLAALVIHSRPGQLKLDENRRQVVLNLRMAALFYVMVTPIVRAGSVTNLAAESTTDGIRITPTLRNDGNSHVRPIQSIVIVASDGSEVARVPEHESMPVLAGAELSRPIDIPRNLPAGEYTVRYRVDFKTGAPLVEGRTTVLVKNEARGEQRTNRDRVSKGSL
jgi:hypothetical protein